MVKEPPIPDSAPRYGRRPVRPWRPWAWGASAWLGNGGVAVAFYLAARTGTLGILALVAFLGSFLLRQVLEATSQGD